MKKIIVFILIIVTLFNSCLVVYGSDFNVNTNYLGSFGCTNEFDGLLLSAGEVAGIDPVALKVIMCRESGGVPSKIGENKTKTGEIWSTDIGLMQINSENTRGYSEDDLLTNVILNVYVATDIIKEKRTMASVSNLGKSYGSTTLVGKDSYSLFWGYNGFSEAGENYAREIHEEYINFTKLPTTTKKIENEYGGTPFIDVVDINTMVTGSVMSYEDFMADIIPKYKEYTGNDLKKEDFFSGNLPNRDSNYRRTYENTKVDAEYTTVVGGQAASKIDYTSYKFTKSVISAIFYIISILIYVLIVYLIFIWVLYIFYSLGVTYVNKIMSKVTKGHIDCADEEIFNQLIIITICTLAAVSVVLTGLLQKAVMHVVLYIMIYF